jgi:folate-binding protein YgfZ
MEGACIRREQLAVGAASWRRFALPKGFRCTGSISLERDLPQETSQMRALNFNKGCYLGQEIVERIRSRGSVHRHLRQLELMGRCRGAGPN